MTQQQLGFDSEDLRKQAERNRRRWKDPNARIQSEDDAQEAVLRFLQAGGMSAVNHSRGTARALAGGFLRKVQLEGAREAKGPIGPLPEEVEDRNPVRADSRVLESATAFDSGKPHPVLCVWWAGLTKRRRMAVVKIHGPMFGLQDALPVKPSDYTASCRAMKHLRAMGAECRKFDSE